MKIILRGLVLSAVLMALHGCAPMGPGPATPPRPTSSLPPPLPPQTQPLPQDELVETIKPAEQPQQAPSSAIAGLMTQGWALYERKNYQGALGIAERAQRIDSRSPEVYLLMARSHLALYQTGVAEQLARRGLSLSRVGTAVNRELQALLVQIAQTP